MAARTITVTYSDLYSPVEMLEKMFPQEAVGTEVEKLFKKTDIPGTVSVCVGKRWSPMSDRRRVSLYPVKGGVTAYFRANGRTLVRSISNDQVPSKILYLKLRVACDELNEKRRARWEANSPAREVETCLRQIVSLSKRRQAHRKRISREKRVIAKIERQIAERRQRIKDLKAA